MHLLIDDVRDLPVDIIARTADQGLEQLRRGKITHLYLDNDLGLDQKEGWEILRTALAEGICPDFVQLVTSNPAARNNMKSRLEGAGFFYSASENAFIRNYTLEAEPKEHKTLYEEFGCSAGSCIFGHPGGMQTNGGCQCEKEIRRLGPTAFAATRRIRQLEGEVKALEKERKELLEAANDWMGEYQNVDSFLMDELGADAYEEPISKFDKASDVTIAVIKKLL